MPQPIVIGYDGSEHGRDALALGRALGATLSAPLLVVIAYTPQQWLWAPGTAEPMDEPAREQLLEQARAAFPDEDAVEIRTVASPSAAGALHAEAERVGASIIVVGCSHRGRMSRALLGTVAQEVLDAAPAAVAVAPAGLADASKIGFSRIGVGFDDSPSAYDALAVAHRIAGSAHAELRLLWAAHLVARALPLAATSYLNPDYFEQVRAEVEDRLEQAAAPMREEVSIRAEIVRGETTHALIEQSERLDMLVLGSRGYGPFRRVLLGSVSRGVIAGAGCPVLIVPRGSKTLEAMPTSADPASAQEGEHVGAPALSANAGRREPDA